MEFAKLHALGNDFLVAAAGDGEQRPRSLGDLARLSCDRHRGVGADGIVFYQATSGDPDAEFSILIFNADGSRAEMSGNGVRCAAAFLMRSGRHSSSTLRIRTVSGIKRLDLEGSEGLTCRFRCSMGVPTLDPAKIPVRIHEGAGPLIDYPIPLGASTVQAALCSMGNPHCSTFWPDVERAPLPEIGPRLETHELFPNRTNVEFIQVLDPHRLRVRFWERGVGPTLCSGTGSSAAAVAAILKGLAQSPVRVETELGHLDVAWIPGDELFLTGPATFICEGEWPTNEHE